MPVYGSLPSRLVVPEILDSLSHDDPRSTRSRKDLRVLDWFLGNSRWVLRMLRRSPSSPGDIAELGAGEGRLCAAIARLFPAARVTAYDLAPPCEGLHWVQGDFLQCLSDHEIVVGALIVHHFSQEQLLQLGRKFKSCRRIFLTEPLRSRIPLVLGGLAAPFVGEVTRHDMPASIRAGFLPGELGPLLGLAGWRIVETVDLRGSLRFQAWQS